MGDFNFPGINWESLDSDSHGENFLNIVQDCFLIQHVLTPTRGNNILDLVLSTEEGMVEDLNICGQLANSDHNMIMYKLVCKTISSTNSCLRLDYSKGDYAKLTNLLNSVD